MSRNLEISLTRIEALARGSILRRLLHRPLRYVQAIGYWRLVYPLRKQGKFAKARTFFGADMQVVLPSATEIFLFGAKTHDSEIRLARFLMKHLLPGSVFCDVGAHFGYFTLLASHLAGPQGRVAAFEASAATFSILKKNTAPFSNISVFQRAASDTSQPLVFHEFPALFSEYNSLFLPEKEKNNWLHHNPPQRIEVQGQCLGDFFEQEQCSPDIIKIDVEGAEPQVLRGMEFFLKNNAPILVMEYLTAGSQQQAHRQALAYVHSLGYQLYRIKNNGDTERCEDLEAAMQRACLQSDNVVLRKRLIMRE